jgi:hypothetical protein
MFQKGDRVRVRGTDKLGEVLGTVLSPGQVKTYSVKLDDGTISEYVEPILELQPKQTRPGNPPTTA